MTDKKNSCCELCKISSKQYDGTFFCLECALFLCEQCRKSHGNIPVFKDHRLASKIEYERLKSYFSLQDCEKHNRKYEFLCQFHNTMTCLKCILLEHNKCELRNLKQYPENLKTLEFGNIKQLAADTLKTVKNDMKLCTDTMESLGGDEDTIKDKFSMMRQALNEHLDKLEDRILEEIKSKQKLREDVTDFQKELEQKQKKLKQLQNDIEVIKKFACDTEFSINLREINETIKKIRDELCSSKVANDFLFSDTHSLSDINEQLETLESTVEEIGEVVDFKLGQHYHATESESEDESTQVNDREESSSVQLTHVCDVNIKKGKNAMNITGCAILPDDRLIFSDYGNKRLVVHKPDGAFFLSIRLSESPYDISVLDQNTVIVSYNTKRRYLLDAVYIEPLEIDTIYSESSPHNCWGVSCSSGLIYVVFYPEGIRQLNRRGEVMKTIPISVHHVYHINAFQDRIYYTVRKNNAVCCCDMNGILLWEFQDSELQCNPKCSPGLTIDNEGNVFVVGVDENVILHISQDGNHSSTVLDKSNNLDMPTAVCFHTFSRRLLITNRENGRAVIFSATPSPN